MLAVAAVCVQNCPNSFTATAVPCCIYTAVVITDFGTVLWKVSWWYRNTDWTGLENTDGEVSTGEVHNFMVTFIAS